MGTPEHGGANKNEKSSDFVDKNAIFANGPDVFDQYGVDAKDDSQAIYVIRPDNYVAWRSSGFDFDACHQFLSEFGVSPTQTVQLSASM